MNSTIETRDLHTLPPLPYAQGALEPVISATTISFHYGKHHRGYVETLSTLVAGTELADLTLSRIIAETAGRTDKVAIFNNAAQAWNHGFYWRSLRPKGGGEPPAALKHRIEASFANLDACKEALVTASTTQFGSGWGWLVLNKDKLEVYGDKNQDSPYMNGHVPILGIDVWEHAYYLKYQNKRPDYIKAWWNVVNWDAVAERYKNAMKG